MKRTVGLVLVGLFCFLTLNAEIVEIQEISKILPAIENPNTLVLIDMDDTLTDSTLMLGTGLWRKSLRENGSRHVETLKKLNLLERKEELHDRMTHFVATRIPVKPVEEAFPTVVAEMQAQSVPVYVFTARGKKKWYSTEISNIDSLTDAQLEQAGYAFQNTVPPAEWSELDPAFYGNGVLYTSPIKKGIFLKNLIEKTGYRPAKIVFIDDKKDQVESVEKAAAELGIPYVGFWYTRADREHTDFDEEITMVQWTALESSGMIMSDQQAAQRIKEMRSK